MRSGARLVVLSSLRSAFAEWNAIGFDLIAGAERGPTISSRQYGLLNRAMHEAVKLVEALGLFVDAALIQRLGQHAVAVAADDFLEAVGVGILDDQYLENRWDLSEGTPTDR